MQEDRISKVNWLLDLERIAEFFVGWRDQPLCLQLVFFHLGAIRVVDQLDHVSAVELADGLGGVLVLLRLLCLAE